VCRKSNLITADDLDDYDDDDDDADDYLEDDEVSVDASDAGTNVQEKKPARRKVGTFLLF
jgi:hypothetical protein